MKKSFHHHSLWVHHSVQILECILVHLFSLEVMFLKPIEDLVPVFAIPQEPNERRVSFGSTFSR